MFTLMPNQVGPAPPFFELSFRRLPFKDTSQDPGGQREREWRVQRKATLTSLLPLVLRLQLVPRPRQRALPAPQSWRDHLKELLCIPSLSPPETSRENGIDRLEETRQARTTARAAAHEQEDMMKEEAVSEM